MALSGHYLDFGSKEVQPLASFRTHICAGQGKPIYLAEGGPILPVLEDIIARSPTGDLTFLVTSFGKPFTAAGFGNWFREQCDEAALPHCSAHGLPKAGATIAAERGATDRQLMALYDWETAAQANVYTAAADRRQLAGEAARLLAGDQNVNSECPTKLPHRKNPTIFQSDKGGGGGSDGTRTRDLRRDRPTL